METWKYKVGLIELTSWLKPLFGIFLGGSLVFPTLITSYHGWYLQEWEPKACSDSIVKSLVAVVGSPVIGFFSDWMWFFRFASLFEAFPLRVGPHFSRPFPARQIPSASQADSALSPSAAARRLWFFSGRVHPKDSMDGCFLGDFCFHRKAPLIYFSWEKKRWLGNPAFRFSLLIHWKMGHFHESDDFFMMWLVFYSDLWCSTVKNDGDRTEKWKLMISSGFMLSNILEIRVV